ncbi:MAG: DNA replication/repair protein RecF [Paraglaciecola sp.]|uniref:DNA replication/repair protein RecF n=1 Tax=Paraglaciecola sp. TaxID=1920173 RepID=UPI003297F12E
MKLDKVQISNFRNLDSLSFTLNKNLNIFIGENGSGKSSILEALHYLGFARSFRTSKHKNVIQSGKDNFTVYCSSQEKELNSFHKLGISRHRDDSCVVNINGVKSKKASDLVSYLPIQIFTPQSSDLLLGAPKLRRRFIDWLLFHVEQNFNLDSNVFMKSLKQLNALYKNNTNNNLGSENYWAELFCNQGGKISEQRENLLTIGLIPMINSTLADFLPEFSFEISYYRGWEKELTLEQSLKKNLIRDLRNGFVSAGPHKADIKIKIKGVNAHELLSRGQLRMLVASMQLAQTLYLQSKTNRPSIFLLDDIGAELDEDKRKVFISKLANSDTQLFVTAIDINQLEFIENYNDKTVFHVEHGHVKEEI